MVQPCLLRQILKLMLYFILLRMWNSETRSDVVFYFKPCYCATWFEVTVTTVTLIRVGSPNCGQK